MNTQPGMTGRINPTIPIRTRPTPAAILQTFLKPVPILENLYLPLFAIQTYTIDVFPAQADSTMKLEMKTTQQLEAVYEQQIGSAGPVRPHGR